MDYRGGHHQKGHYGYVRLQAKVRDRGLKLWPRLYAGHVCDDSAADAAVVALYK